MISVWGGARGLPPLRSSRVPARRACATLARGLLALASLACLLVAAAACNHSAAPRKGSAKPAASPARVARTELTAAETRAAGPARTIGSAAATGPAKAGAAAAASSEAVGKNSGATETGATAAKPELARERYAWLASDAARPAEVEPLVARFAPPPGFERVALRAGSFGEWLRGLPLAAPGTPVLSYGGSVRYPADDRRIAAVTALDVGTADLQQCADTVMRLHGEWAWSRGRRDMTYDAASGMALPYQRFARGERVTMDGGKLIWKAGRPPAAGHAGFRDFMNMVFAWSNTVSLARQAKQVAAGDVRPGDFFVLPGNPGHTVLLLDVARNAEGQAVALIGQSYMPAQNFYILRGDRDPWFALEPGKPVDTPFWVPFPWDALRRLDE